MPPFFWSSPTPAERARTIQTLRSLGTTSIPGLAVALSLSVRRTHRILQEIQRQGPPGLVYEHRSGAIRWEDGSETYVARPRASPPAPSQPSPRGAPQSEPRPTEPTWASPASTFPEAFTTPVVVSPVRAARPTGPQLECTRCHIPMVPSGIEGVFSCPMCGRRVSGTGMLISVATAPAAARSSPTDQRQQELLAAWATGQPLTCPKCRAPLQKAGVALFRCRSCGETVKLEIAPPREEPPLAPPTPSTTGPAPGS